MIISIGNSCFSFFTGFAVFSVVGYLNGIGSPVASETSSIGLAFIAYPAAIETLKGANFWTLMLALTLFGLGIDSSFSILEATSTVIHDTELGKKIPKMVVALLLCIAGAVCSTVFCFNWGFTYFDIVDHYLNVYLVLIMGILQSIAATWVFGFEDAISKGGTASVALLTCGYWCVLIPLGLISYFVFTESSWMSIPAFWIWLVLVAFISFKLSKLKFKEWWTEVFLSGARPICTNMLSLSKTEISKINRNIFEIWFCVCIKYVFPWAVWWLLSMTL